MPNEDLLKTWRGLNAGLYALTEDEVKRLLDMELTSRRRPRMIERLHQRYSSLRCERERLEMMLSAAQT